MPMEANPSVDATSAPAAAHAGLKDLFSYPLMACVQDRRTRRVARGVSITADDISHESTNAPAPLTPLEEAILIAATGITGAVMHDGPTNHGKNKELGSPFLNVISRAASSPDNAQATSFFMINDEAIWLIKRPRGRDALEMAKSIPPRWEDRTEGDWLASAAAVTHKVHDGRMDFPRDWPYYLGWNRQHSNAPGTTVFLPVVDNTRQYINAILILTSEPKGIAPLIIDDYKRFTPRGAMEYVAWVAMQVGLAPAVPYQPIGGIKRVRQGYFSKDNPITLNAVGAARTDHEAWLALQNLLLVTEAMRLGGWIHSGILPPHIWKRDPAKGLLGLGFREDGPKKRGRFSRWPPAPASQPNYVGIDGILEGLCPPYVIDMDAAVDQLLEDKYGPNGTYGDKEVFATAYKDQASADAYLRSQAPHPKESVEYTKEICRYLYETYGRFPAHTDAFNLPGLWVQVSNLELEYYDKYAKPSHFHRQAEGNAIWGRS
ncbi:MAG: hypothetical protein ACRD2W_04075 [Acidimicrobiales bacterium]